MLFISLIYYLLNNYFIYLFILLFIYLFINLLTYLFIHLFMYNIIILLNVFLEKKITFLCHFITSSY